MDIDGAIDVLMKFRRLGAKEILIARDFAPGGDFQFNHIPTPIGTPQLVWVCEVEDDITRMRDKALERQAAVVLKKDLIGLDVNGRACEACNSFMHNHEWVIMDQNGFVEFCEHSIALIINAQ